MEEIIDKRKFYRNYIIISSLLCLSILFIIEQVFMVDYITKTISKIIMFTLSSIFLIKVIRKTTFKDGLNIGLIKKRTIGLGLLLGIISACILIGVFLVFQKIIDLETIFLELETKSKITASNYIVITAYLSFGNSFLEEFFFRGFIFMNLFKMGYKKFAYIFSATLFSLYHIGIFKSWFSFEIFILCIVGLFVTGIIFNYVDTKSNNFLNSWIIHILANLAIVTIGYVYLF